MILLFHSVLPPPPPWDQGGNDFCVISQAGGGATTNRDGVKIILGSQAGGELLYHDQLLVFLQNASP